jgi:tetratricopeptide (TPR) repeat protein
LGLLIFRLLLLAVIWAMGLCETRLSAADSTLTNSSPVLSPTLSSTRLVTARDFYNEGTRLLRTGKLREAESSLQTAVASDDETVQPEALYNLAHARFQQGEQVLRDGPKTHELQTFGATALAAGDQALQTLNAASATDSNNQIILAAYLRARGASKQLKSAIKAVQDALDEYGAILLRWERAAGDFRSAAELNPTDTQASFNAAVVDRQIADLVDQKSFMQLLSKNLMKKRQQVRDAMMQIQQRMPKGKIPGDEEDDDDEPDPKDKEPKTGPQEAPDKEGQRMAMTWEEAARLLQTLKLDSNRKLPIGTKQTERPQNRKGRDW